MTSNEKPGPNWNVLGRWVRGLVVNSYTSLDRVVTVGRGRTLKEWCE